MSDPSAATFVRKSVGWSIGSKRAHDSGRRSGDRFANGCRYRRESLDCLAARFQRVRSSGVFVVHAEPPEDSSGSCWSEFCTWRLGVYLLVHPIAGLASLTIALAAYLILESVLEFALGLKLRPLPGSG
jgi:hypothetical protein